MSNWTWVCLAALVVSVRAQFLSGQRLSGQVFSQGQGQRPGGHRPAGGGQRPGGPPGSESDTRLGLLGPDMGLPAVVTSSPIIGSPGNLREDDCQLYCIPVNQRCIDISLRNLASNINVRIVNNPQPGQSVCPGETLCCGGRAIPQSSAGQFGGRPLSSPLSGTLPLQQRGNCGNQYPIQFRNAGPAEADLGEYPWMAALLSGNNEYVAGGALLGPQWVLTATHKIVALPQNAISRLYVRLGDLDLGQPVDHPQYPIVEVPVAQIISHPGYDGSRLSNDVTLLRLARPINLNNYPHIAPVCLPEQNQHFGRQEACIVTGWGKNSFGNQASFQRVLKEVDVPIVDFFRCENQLKSTPKLSRDPNFSLDSSFLCAGGVSGKDACEGDGGSPLVCRTNRGWVVAGLVAWGVGCGMPDVPGVYVNVAKFSHFIQQHTGLTI